MSWQVSLTFGLSIWMAVQVVMVVGSSSVPFAGAVVMVLQVSLLAKKAQSWQAKGLVSVSWHWSRGASQVSSLRPCG
jgi:hypothetical protein